MVVLKNRLPSEEHAVLAVRTDGALDQQDKNVQGAVAEPHWPVVLEQEPLLCEEREPAERDPAFVHG